MQNGRVTANIIHEKEETSSAKAEEAEHKQTQILEKIYISAMANPYADSEEDLDQQPEPVVPEVAPEAEVVPEVEPEDRTAQFHKHIKYIKKRKSLGTKRADSTAQNQDVCGKRKKRKKVRKMSMK